MTAREDQPQLGTCDYGPCSQREPHEKVENCVNWRAEDQPRPTPPFGYWEGTGIPRTKPASEAHGEAPLCPTCGSNAPWAAFKPNCKDTWHRQSEAHPSQDARWPDCRDFYELMQKYRHWPLEDQAGTCAAFQAVIEFVQAGARSTPSLPVDLSVRGTDEERAAHQLQTLEDWRTPSLPAQDAREFAKKWLAENQPGPIKCDNCGEVQNTWSMPSGAATYCRNSPQGTGGHVYMLTIGGEDKTFERYAACAEAYLRGSTPSPDPSWLDTELWNFAHALTIDLAVDMSEKPLIHAQMRGACLAYSQSKAPSPDPKGE